MAYFRNRITKHLVNVPTSPGSSWVEVDGPPDDDADHAPADLSGHTKAELVEQAAARGVEVPANATKAQAIDALVNAPPTT